MNKVSKCLIMTVVVAALLFGAINVNINASEADATPKATRIIELSPEINGFNIKWSKSKGATGYEIEYTEDIDFNKSETIYVDDCLDTELFFDELKPATFYYLRIRSVKDNGERDYYSNWSKSVSFCTLKNKEKIKSIKSKDDVKYIIRGCSYNIVYQVKPIYAANQDIIFASSDKKVATVNEDGKVKALKNGVTTITVKASDGSKKKTKIKIYVVDKLKRINLDKSIKNIQIGRKWANKVKANNITINSRRFTYSSSDITVATVDKYGNVKGKSIGQATITVRTNDGSSIKTKFKVNVVKSILNKTSITIDSGSQYQLSALNDGDSVKWTSSDKAVAKVNSKGIVKAVGPGKATITAKIKGNKYVCKVEVLSSNPPIGEYLYAFNINHEHTMSDHTFIENDLYCINASNDTHTNNGKVWIYSVNPETHEVRIKGSIMHNLGHANTVDYSKENDALILGNGSADSSLEGHFFILYNPGKHTRWTIEDCIDFDMSSYDWGIKMQAVWGEEPDIVYIVTEDNRLVHKLRLGMDEDNNFDGTFDVIGEWYTNVTYDVNQGTVFYKGKLYAGIGHCQLQVLESQLNDDGTITQTVYKDPLYEKDGQCLIKPFTEGITIRDGLLYLGGSDRKIRVYKIGE